MYIKVENLLNRPEVTSSEIIEEILCAKNIRFEKIYSNGHASPENFWYDQEEDELILVFEGEAILELNDEEIFLKKGDHCRIEKHLKHRVKYVSSDCIWFCIFY